MKLFFSTLFPAVDPIPLPAPVWLLKALHQVTLTLHFVALEIVLGGLLVACLLNFLGTAGTDSPNKALRRGAAAGMARRFPVIMTFLINFGVPPLLFAQVLYGRALYTSSALIGAWWISVIGLLMLCYGAIYRMSACTERDRPAWIWGLVAWLLAGAIAKIYTTNMTLMLRPEIWNAMYSTTASGTILPTGDPTKFPRWLHMMMGGFGGTGLWCFWLAAQTTFQPEQRTYLARLGGGLVAVFLPLQGMAGWMIYQAQNDEVRAALQHSLPAQIAAGAWAVLSLGLTVFGAWAFLQKPTGKAAAWIALLGGALWQAAFVVWRDQLRDLTLLTKGFDVWDRVVVTNWSVVGIFLGLFVGGLVVLGWLVSVVAQAKPWEEKAA
jgi:hypothetical protein